MTEFELDWVSWLKGQIYPGKDDYFIEQNYNNKLSDITLIKGQAG